MLSWPCVVLGAGRGRLVRQLLGGDAGDRRPGVCSACSIVLWGLDALVGTGAGLAPKAGEAHVDATVLAFTMLLHLATARCSVGPAPTSAW